MLTDPVADMLARIRNALMRKKPSVIVPNSRIKRGILDVLIREGYVVSYDVENLNLCVHLKYWNGRSVIQEMRRVSKPSVKIYSPLRKLSPFANGLGVSILTTSRGIMSDREARQVRVGGKILLTVR